MNNYNQFRAMLSITRASLRSIFRSPSAVVFSLVFPLIFILVFGFIGGGGGKIDVSLSPGSDTLNPLVKVMDSIDFIRLYHPTAEEENTRLLREGVVDATLSLNVTYDSSGMKIDAVIHALPSGMARANQLKGFIDEFKMRAYLAKFPMIHIAEVKPTAIVTSAEREFKTIDFILPGQLGFSLLSTGVFGTAFVFLSLRQTLVIKRFFATPIKRPYIVVGEALSRVIFGMMGSVVIILLGYFLFGFTLVHGVFTLIQMLLLCFLGLTVFMGFGFVVSGIAKNESTVPPLANLITLPQFLLSGTFFSTSNFPGWLQPISNALPLTYMNHAMRKIAFEGASFMDVGKDIGILSIWGVVVYALAIKFFRWE